MVQFMPAAFGARGKVQIAWYDTRREGVLPPDILVMDLHYVPEQTRLLKEAEAAGAKRAMNGDFMLVEQTVAAFELWTGEKAPRSVIEKTLKKARNKPDTPVPSAEEQAADHRAAPRSEFGQQGAGNDHGGGKSEIEQ